MSTHIQMADEYNQVTTYYGALDDKYQFMVEISYNSEIGNHNIDSIEFLAIKRADDMSKEYWSKSKEKINDFVLKWLFNKPKNQEELENEE
jgi:hypothetical protein